MNYQVLIVLAAVCLYLTATVPSKTSEKRAESRRIQRQSSKLFQRIGQRKIDASRRSPAKSSSKPKLIKTIDYTNCPTNIGTNTVCGVVLPLLHCYCFVLTPQSWTDARDFCQSQGMNLLRIESLRELTQLGAVSLSTDEWWTDAYLTTINFYSLGGFNDDYFNLLSSNTCPTVTLTDLPASPCNSTAYKAGGTDSELDPGPVLPCNRQLGIVMIGLTFKTSCFSAQPADTLLLSICQS